MKASGYGVLSLLVMDAFVKLGHGYAVKGYTEEIVHDFEQRHETIFERQVNRVHLLDFEGLTPNMRQDLVERLRMVYTRDDGQEEFAWVAQEAKRQPVAIAVVPRGVEDALDINKGRLEEEIQGLRHDVRSLQGLMKRPMTDQGRFSTWMVSCMTQLMEASGRTYQAFDGTFRGSYPEVFEIGFLDAGITCEVKDE
ncbi:hypothetical protein Tco_1525618 [Tanacetum coccineum]